MNKKIFLMATWGLQLGLFVLLASCGSAPSAPSAITIQVTPTPVAQIITLPQKPTPMATEASRNPPSSRPGPAATTVPTPAPTIAAGATATEGQIAQAVFQAVNQSRASAGLPALQWSGALSASARQHDLTMAVANTLSHQIKGEAAFGDRERAQGVNWTYAEENIGETNEMDVNGALSMHQKMMAEKPPDNGHRTNILSKQVSLLGVDVLLDTQHGLLWLTEDFAQPA